MQNYNYYPDPRENEIYLAERGERKRLGRAALAVTAPCFVFFLFTEFYRNIVLFIGGSLGFSEEKTIKFLSDPFVVSVAQIAVALVILTLPFVLSAKAYGFNISHFAALKKPRQGTSFPFFLFGVGFCAFANVAVNSAGRVFERFGLKSPNVREALPEGTWGFLITVVATAIVPALVEEFAFRGIIQGILLPFGEAFSILATATTFGMLHGNFEQIPFAFLVGLVLGFIRIKTGSLAICMAVHAANNLISVLASYSRSLPVSVSNMIYTVYILSVLMLAILGVALIKNENTFDFKEYQGVLAAKKRYAGFFFSLSYIAFFMLFLFRAVNHFF